MCPFPPSGDQDGPCTILISPPLYLSRDEGVKKACTKMLATKWIQQADDNLLEFLERLDVMSSTVADDVLKAFFDYRADILGNLSFNGKAQGRLGLISAKSLM